MTIYLCPGYHSPALTEQFIQAIWPDIVPPHRPSPALSSPIIVFPSDRLPPYSPRAIADYLHHVLRDLPQASPAPQGSGRSPVLWIAFSAGVVGAILAARQGQRQGYPVDKFIAIDGWGVPLGQDFPVYRMAHDFWTHRSQSWMDGVLQFPQFQRSLQPAGNISPPCFVADPPVPHLELWRSSHTVTGTVYPEASVPPALRSKCYTAADCLRAWTNTAAEQL